MRKGYRISVVRIVRIVRIVRGVRGVLAAGVSVPSRIAPRRVRPKVSLQAGQTLQAAAREVVEPEAFFGRDITGLVSRDETVADLGSRCAGYVEESCELAWVVARKSFRHVAGGGAGSIGQLAPELPVLNDRRARRDLENLRFQFPHPLPGQKIFEPAGTIH